MNTAIAQPQHRNWEMLCHLSALSMFVGIPFGNILGPLILWLVKRHDHPSIDEHGKEALNFQLSLSLYLLAGFLTTISLMIVLVGFLLLPALIIACIVGPLIDLVLVIIAAMKASEGQLYRYPATIRFIK